MATTSIGAVILQQMIRAGRLDRSLYNELLYDDYATGNAVLVVALVYAFPAAAAVLFNGASFFLVIGEAFSGIIRWLLVSLAFWAMATKVFERDGRVPTAVRLVGFAHVAFIPWALRVIVPDWQGLLLLASLAWFFAGLTAIGRVLYDLDQQQSMAAAAVGTAAWWVLVIIL